MSLLTPIIEQAKQANPVSQGDFIGEDGYLHCSVCGEPKEFDITVRGEKLRVPVICECVREKNRRLEEQRQAQQRELRRESAFPDKPSQGMTFERDLSPGSPVSQAVRQYARSFSPESGWLVLYGTCGTGKSFYAKCIANAVIDKGCSAKFVTLPEVERMLWNNKGGDVYGWLDSFGLLILDDLFSERDTDYMREIVFRLIDMRSCSAKPLIVTTNLTSDGVMHPKDQCRERIISRLRERSRFIAVLGADRRIHRS